MDDFEYLSCFMNEVSILPKKIGVSDARAVKIMVSAENTINQLLQSQTEKLEKVNEWALMHNMYNRALDYTKSAMLLLLVGQITSAEAMCRTSVEASINLYYVSVTDSIYSILAYFKSYLTTERKQNLQWLRSVDKSQLNQESKDDHRKRITEKNNALNQYESILRESFNQLGIDFDKACEKWPSIYDRFAKLGKEVDYRTIYAALCSQAHNDPEDLLNDFVAGVTNIKGFEKCVELERTNFSRYMVYTSIQFLLESAMMYLGKVNIPAHEQLFPMFKQITLLMGDVAEEGPTEIKK